MSSNSTATEYRYNSADQSHAHGYLLPGLKSILDDFYRGHGAAEKRIFDLGCGNGSVANFLSVGGYEVSGVDPSTEGIANANQSFPDLRLEQGSAYDPLAEIYGEFPVVYSLEVVEHVYSPREYAKTLYSLTKAGGVAIVSTPYHGYLKNLALSVTGKMDQHFTALWDHGHIKFWSIATLGTLLTEAGFSEPQFHRVGRFGPLAKSMIAVAQKPE